MARMTGEKMGGCLVVRVRCVVGVRIGEEWETASRDTGDPGLRPSSYLLLRLLTIQQLKVEVTELFELELAAAVCVELYK